MSAKASNTWRLKVGDKVLCIEGVDSLLTKGKIYRVVEVDSSGGALIINDGGYENYPEGSAGFFAPVKEEYEYSYTEISLRWGLKVGDKLHCTDSIGRCLTKGKIYEVFKIDSERDAVVIDDSNEYFWPEGYDTFFGPVLV